MGSHRGRITSPRSGKLVARLAGSLDFSTLLALFTFAVMT